MKEIISDLIRAISLVKEGSKVKKVSLKTYAKLVPFIVTNKIKMFWGIVGVIIVALLGIPGPILLGRIVDVILPSHSLNVLVKYIVILVSINLLSFIFSFLMSYYFSKLSQSIILSIKQNLYAKVLRLPCSYFDKTQTGYVVSRLEEVNLLDALFSPVFVKVIMQIFEAVICIIVMTFISWKLTLVSLIVLPLIYVIARLGAAGVQAVTNNQLEQSAAMAMNMQESLNGIEIIKLLSKEKEEVEKLNIKIHAVAQSNLSQGVILVLFNELSINIASVAGYTILLLAGFLITKNEITIGNYLAFSGLMSKVFGCVNTIVSMSMSIRFVGVALERIFSLESLVSEDEDPDRTIKVDNLEGIINIDNISFSYIEGAPVFNDFSLHITKGSKVLISGESGSGKSTLFKLLLGRYNLQKGKITIDGIDIKKLELTSLRENISIVTQNMFLFNDTILNNILYGRSNASKEDAIYAAQMAGAHEFIMRMENGYETAVGERGLKLSGGQVQRISIARALIKKSNIILFDEPVSSLDDSNVELIHEVITTVYKDKTCLVISHRKDIDWVTGFDKVIKIGA